MMFALVTNDVGLNVVVVAGFSIALVFIGAVAIWAIHGENKKPGENEDNRGNLK